MVKKSYQILEVSETATQEEIKKDEENTEDEQAVALQKEEKKPETTEKLEKIINELQSRLEEISNIVLPGADFNFTILKAEIERLKNGNLSYQLQVKKQELESSLAEMKKDLEKKSDNESLLYFLYFLDQLLKTQSDIIKIGSDDFVQERLQDIKRFLRRKLSEEEIEGICQKQEEIIWLEQAIIKFASNSEKAEKQKLEIKVEIPPKNNE